MKTPEPRFLGYYETRELPLAVRPGRMVTIKKGTIVKTVGREPKPAGRTYKVKVNHILPGITRIERKVNYEVTPPHSYEERTHESNPKVVWAGPGGYWSEVDLNDIPEAVASLPSLAECERRLGEKADTWKGRCFEIASTLVALGLVKGTAVYGHWRGPVAPESFFAAKSHLGFVQHGWVLMPDRTILDPTRWVFENVEPYLHVGPGTSKEYDEGGNGLRAAFRRSPPPFDPSDRQIEFSASVLPSAPWTFVEKLLDIDYTDQKPGFLTISQVFWLANLPLQDLGPHARAIYDAFAAVGEEATIPLDNRQKVLREAT